MITRDLPRNRYLEATGNPRLRTTAGDVITASRTADYMTDLAARQVEIASAERRGQPARSLPMQMYDREGNRIEADDLSGIAGGPDRDIPGPRPEVERIDPETLNERYRDLGLEFDAPMTEDGAQILADAKKAEMVRQDIIARGPEGVAGGAAVLAGGLAGMATDPLEVMSAIVPVVGQARAASIIGRLGTVRGRAVIGATEGLVGAAATEPIVAIMSRQQQLDYTFNDALLNTVLGGMLGAGIGTTAGVLRKFRGGDVTLSRSDVTPERVDTPETRATAPERVTQDAPRVTQETARTATETGEAVQATPAVRTAEAPPPAPAQRAGEAILPTREDEAAAARVALSQTATGRVVDVEPVVSAAEMRQMETDLRREYGSLTRPLVQTLRRSGVQIHPDGPAGQEMRARGLTPQSAPGLFSRARGRQSLDNIDPATMPSWVRDELPTDETGNYMDERSLVDAIAEELNGRRLPILALDEFAAMRATAERPAEDMPWTSEQDLARRAQDPANDFSADVEASREISDRLASGRDDWLSEDEAFLMAEIEALRVRGEVSDAVEANLREADQAAEHATAAGDVARAYAACMATR